jgi:hypothetical protein
MTALYWIAASLTLLAAMSFASCSRLWIERAHQRQGGSKSYQFSGLDHGRLNIPPAE